MGCLLACALMPHRGPTPWTSVLARGRRLLSLFRLIHVAVADMRTFRFVARRGKLFDPASNSRSSKGTGSDGKAELPMVPDATVWKVLQSLMVLDGERLSYRTLDVEQIGSVYEVDHGLPCRVDHGPVDRCGLVQADRCGSRGRSRWVARTRRRSKRAKALQDATDRKLMGKVAAVIATRCGIEPAEELVAALDARRRPGRDTGHLAVRERRSFSRPTSGGAPAVTTRRAR